MAHAYPKATKHISKTSFRSTKMKATPMAHCIINRNVSPKTVLSERRYGRDPHGTSHIPRHFSAFKHTCKKATSMAHHMPVGTEMSLNYVCLLAKKKAIPMAHRMLNNIETTLAKTSSCASTKASPMAHAYPKATRCILKTSFPSTQMKATPMAHCIINRDLLKLLCLSTTTDAIPMAHRMLQGT